MCFERGKPAGIWDLLKERWLPNDDIVRDVGEICSAEVWS